MCVYVQIWCAHADPCPVHDICSVFPAVETRSKRSCCSFELKDYVSYVQYPLNRLSSTFPLNLQAACSGFNHLAPICRHRSPTFHTSPVDVTLTNAGRARFSSPRVQNLAASGFHSSSIFLTGTGLRLDMMGEGHVCVSVSSRLLLTLIDWFSRVLKRTSGQ